jgi:hypothetical protein
MSPTLNFRKFDGKIIYATPGSGKTYLAENYDYVVDGDEIFLELINDYFPEFEIKTNCHPSINLSRFYHYNQRKYMRLVSLAEEKFLELKENNNHIVLIGTLRLMHLADLVFVQSNDRINANRNFNQQKEYNKIDELLDDGVLDSSQIKKMNTYLEEYLRN